MSPERFSVSNEYFKGKQMFTNLQEGTSRTKYKRPKVSKPKCSKQCNANNVINALSKFVFLMFPACTASSRYLLALLWMSILKQLVLVCFEDREIFDSFIPPEHPFLIRWTILRAQPEGCVYIIAVSRYKTPGKRGGGSKSLYWCWCAHVVTQQCSTQVRCENILTQGKSFWRSAESPWGNIASHICIMCKECVLW